MKKVAILFLSLVTVFTNVIPVMACDGENETAECSSNENSRIVIQSDIVCPACGAIGYPTGKISFGASDDEVVPYFLPIYQEMQCSKDSSHIWYVYIADATQ